jgi:hypothetical protein
MKPEIKYEIVKLTPALAVELLKRNTNNRTLREGHVESLRESMARDEWQLTHQGLAFAADGELLDGQHRLAAIARMPEDWSCQMLVASGFDRETVFPVIDAVQCKRNVADVLRIDRGLAEVATFLARLQLAGNQGLTPVYVEAFADWARPRFDALVSYAPRKLRTWSSAPVRAAGVVAIELYRDPDYVALVYGALVNQDYNAMSRVVQSMLKAYTNGNVRASQQMDLFLRCLKIFNAENADLHKVQIMDASKALASVRDLLNRCVLHTITNKAGVMRKPSRAQPRQQAVIEGL